MASTAVSSLSGVATAVVTVLTVCKDAKKDKATCDNLILPCTKMYGMIWLEALLVWVLS